MVLTIAGDQKSAPLSSATCRVSSTGTRHNPLLLKSFFPSPSSPSPFSPPSCPFQPEYTHIINYHKHLHIHFYKSYSLNFAIQIFFITQWRIREHKTLKKHKAVTAQSYYIDLNLKSPTLKWDMRWEAEWRKDIKSYYWTHTPLVTMAQFHHHSITELAYQKGLPSFHTWKNKLNKVYFDNTPFQSVISSSLPSRAPYNLQQSSNTDFKSF